MNTGERSLKRGLEVAGPVGPGASFAVLGTAKQDGESLVSFDNRNDIT